jgi:predicted Fe-Mo cluster-binding NifX family protein
MKIAVASQNRRTVTGHAGKCRKFWIYEVEGCEVKGKSLLELPIEQSFHASHGKAPHPLDDINALISGGMGMGLRNRLRQKSILALATAETDPDRAVAAWLNDTLAELPPERHHGQAYARSQQIQKFCLCHEG